MPFIVIQNKPQIHPIRCSLSNGGTRGTEKKDLNPKFEIRNSKQIQITKIQMFKTMMICNAGRTINTRGNVGFEDVFSDKRGMTLVEVMIALVVLLVIFLGLIQASIVTIDSNVRNEIRDEAVRIAADTLTTTRATAFTAAALADTATVCVVIPPVPLDQFTRNFRNLSITYTICREIDDLDVNNKEVRIEVRWDWRERTIGGGNPHIHTINSIVRR